MGAKVSNRRVQLNEGYDHRGITTVYSPDDSLGRDDAGNAKVSRVQSFIFGRADVNEVDARRLRDQGVTRK